ncbi:MAG: dTMP kinase [Ancrocorticia sp.]
MTGLFITFEGGDGSGKTTQVNMLAEYLRDCGREVVATREPGGTELGSEIRKLILHGEDMCPKAEALLYAADRAHHIATVVRPALARGAVVLADRYLDSSVAYQGVARDLGLDEVRDLSLWATDGLMPSLTLLLDVPVSVGAERVGASQDRIEAAGAAFHQAVRDEYLKLAGEDPRRWRVIDAKGGVEDVAAQVRDAVLVFLENPQEPAAENSGAVPGAK